MMGTSMMSSAASVGEEIPRRRRTSAQRNVTSLSGLGRRTHRQPHHTTATATATATTSASALTSAVFACLLVLFLPHENTPSLVSAFSFSSTPSFGSSHRHAVSSSSSSSSQARPTTAAASSRFGRTPTQQQQQHRRRRVRARSGPSSATVMAAGYWKDSEDAPAIDPSDEEKMGAQGQHIINW